MNSSRGTCCARTIEAVSWSDLVARRISADVEPYSNSRQYDASSEYSFRRRSSGNRSYHSSPSLPTTGSEWKNAVDFFSQIVGIEVHKISQPNGETRNIIT